MKFISYCAVAALGLSLLACKKEQSSTNFQVRLTDGPLNVEKVNIDIRQVNIRFEKDSVKWVPMQTKQGIYNLLDFQNGADTSIASGNYENGIVKEIRLILGDQNTIVENGVTYPLTIPSGSESGLKIKIAKHLRTTMDSLVIDFDAGLSVKKESDGYKLRPVLKIK